MLKNLKTIRNEKKITQKRLSQLIGYDQTIISLWENGSRDPSTETIINLCKILNTSSDNLLGIENQTNIKQVESTFTTQQQKCIDLLLKVDTSLLNSVEVYLNTLVNPDTEFILKKGNN